MEPEVSRRRLDTLPVTASDVLAARYQRIVRGEDAAHRDWLTTV